MTGSRVDLVQRVLPHVHGPIRPRRGHVGLPLQRLCKLGFSKPMLALDLVGSCPSCPRRLQHKGCSGRRRQGRAEARAEVPTCSWARCASRTRWLQYWEKPAVCVCWGGGGDGSRVLEARREGSLVTQCTPVSAHPTPGPTWQRGVASNCHGSAKLPSPPRTPPHSRATSKRRAVTAAHAGRTCPARQVGPGGVVALAGQVGEPCHGQGRLEYAGLPVPDLTFHLRHLLPTPAPAPAEVGRAYRDGVGVLQDRGVVSCTRAVVMLQKGI